MNPKAHGAGRAAGWSTSALTTRSTGPSQIASAPERGLAKIAVACPVTVTILGRGALRRALRDQPKVVRQPIRCVKP